ncbi:HPr kinase/phosphatase C-terminal domain-containing protein [Sphingomonas sp.]|uniref:HPr kinase/phosphorylase n=1 Tax=Sphingomonas sp. TaxID=28214 RepID=UPI001EB21AD6|nr:HPr kinase/phosphatase C-terminal domain-containing protein [Sphingomonas sp.]MBX3593043.1 HPr kinase/phosphatase C-terminal domain-containing protein [Sphingomonas sp.]
MAIISSETLHASCVAIDGRAVLIEGRSGEGKSDLSLRLIDRGARLVSDDYTICTRTDGALFGAPPATIAGKIEVRGIGLIEMPHEARAPIALLVTILDAPPRMPEGPQTRRIAGIDIPEVALAALEPSAPVKVELALRHLGRVPA